MATRPAYPAWAKPAVLVALIVTALALGATDDAAGVWLLVALVFGLAGDVFLLGESDTRFRLGLASFLVGHLAYVACFIALGLDPQGWNYLSFLVLGGCLLATRQVAASTYLRGGLALAAAGRGLHGRDRRHGHLRVHHRCRADRRRRDVFAVSDTVLARDRFVRPWDRAQLLVMVTYHVGQALIVAGVLGHDLTRRCVRMAP